nr:hypothetical protein [Chitinophagaceae bacterium]
MSNFTRTLLKLTASLLFIVSTIISSAQEIQVTISFVNQKKEPVSLATVTLFNRLDSTRTFTKLTDSSGVAQFVLRLNNQYNVNITSINYQPIDKGITVSGDQT